MLLWKMILKGLTLFLGASSLQFLESLKEKAENKEMQLVNTGLVQVESLKTKKSKFLGLLLTAVPSKCTESLCANDT